MSLQHRTKRPRCELAQCTNQFTIYTHIKMSYWTLDKNIPQEIEETKPFLLFSPKATQTSLGMPGAVILVSVGSSTSPSLRDPGGFHHL